MSVVEEKSGKLREHKPHHPHLRLDEFVQLVDSTARRGAFRGECTGITHDSRHVRPGMIFAALPGAKTDGVVYVDEAIRRGAAAVLAGVSLPRGVSVPWVAVSHPRRATARVACALYGHPSSRLDMFGVTGTNGKTTVSLLVQHLLRKADRFPGRMGTLGCEIGARTIPLDRTTPEAPDVQRLLYEMTRAGCDCAVMEVSSHGLAQDRVRGVEFNARIFTNLTEDHLDFHRSMDEYFHTKALLFEDDDHAAASATSVINVDDAWGRRLILSGGIRADTMTYGFSPEARVRAEQVQGDGGGSWFTLCSPWGDAEVRLSLPGRFNVSNALAAVAAAGAVGVELDAMAQSLRELDAVPGRLEPVANDLGVSIFVDYAHTEDALTHVLRSVRGFLDGRLIVVFGCGGDRHAGKRPDMGATAARLADAVIITSDNPRSEDPMAIIAEIAEGCPDATHVEQVENRREAISRALQSARPGDAVVVAGKGHETTQQIGHTVHPFDDREVIQNLLKEMES